MSHSQEQQSTDNAKPRVLVLSAKNGKSLQKAVEHMREYTTKTSCPVNDLAYTLGSRREHLAHRAFAIIDPDGTISDFEKSRDIPSGMTFVFTGQGAQWAGMGKELMSVSPCFLSSIRAMDQELSLLVNPPSWTLEGKIPYTCANTRSNLTIFDKIEELAKDDETSRVQQPEFAQPLSTAVQIALVDLLEEWGVHPTSVIGHSSGEIAAAYASGAMKAGVAISASYLRGKAVSESTTKTGGMAAVGIPADKARKYLLDDVAVACDNSPQSVTLSGSESSLDKVLGNIKADDAETFCKRLKVCVAYHSGEPPIQTCQCH